MFLYPALICWRAAGEPTLRKTEVEIMEERIDASQGNVRMVV